MFSPLILVCGLDMTSCGTMAAPTFGTRAECEARTQEYIASLPVTPGVLIVRWTCYSWGVPS
jgi:hypothetical protein